MEVNDKMQIEITINLIHEIKIRLNGAPFSKQTCSFMHEIHPEDLVDF